MSSRDEDTLLQSDSDNSEPQQYFTNDDILQDSIQNTTTASPSQERNNNQLDADAPEFHPASFITNECWIIRSFSEQEFADCIAALAQVNLLVIQGEKHPPSPMPKYYFLVALRTPLTNLTTWERVIYHLNMSVKQDFLPSERDEDIQGVINLYCEQLSHGEPVIENIPVRRAMVDFISGKYLSGELICHYMN